MKNLRFVLCIMAFSLSAYAQNSTDEKLKALNDNKQYSEIIAQYANQEQTLSAKGLYYVGMAYYMQEDDANTIKFMDLSIKKDPKDTGPYYIKGSTLNYMGRFNEAIACFKEATKIHTEALVYMGLGDAYYSLGQLKEAYSAFSMATNLRGVQPRAFYMVAQILNEQNDTVNALKAFYKATGQIPATSPLYANTYFNIGLMEYLQGNSANAEPAFQEVIKANPEDYHAYAKLIQVYYNLKQYDKAAPYRQQLYDAQKAGKLKGTQLDDMFCFDQFEHKGHRIMAFERYEEGPKSTIYNKHVFYVHDDEGNILMTVQTEYSPLAKELGSAKYMLCATKGDTHYNSGLGLNDDIKYETLKEGAIKMIDKHL